MFGSVDAWNMGAVAVATVYFGSAESNRQIIEASKHLKRPII
jgi:DhnA family fructose-bisphosphate aldolase class Ia